MSEAINRKIERAERLDRAIFKAMMGAHLRIRA
jgi:hypothetical protein